jgi:hypothetical protein
MELVLNVKPAAVDDSQRQNEAGTAEVCGTNCLINGIGTGTQTQTRTQTERGGHQ